MSRGERGSQVVRIIQGIDHQDGDWLQHGHEFPQHSRREGARVVLPPKRDSAGSTSTISSAVARPNGSGSKFLPPENRKPVLLEKKQTTFAHFAQDARPRRKKSSLGRVLLDGARAVAWLTAALGGERVRGPLGLFRLGRRLPGRFAVSDLFGRESPTGPPMQPPSADSPRRTRPTSIRACSTCCSSPTRPRPSASQPRASVADSRGSSGSRCSCRECPAVAFWRKDDRTRSFSSPGSPPAGRAFVGTPQPIPAKTDRPNEPLDYPAQPAQLHGSTDPENETDHSDPVAGNELRPLADAGLVNGRWETSYEADEPRPL